MAKRAVKAKAVAGTDEAASVSRGKVIGYARTSTVDQEAGLEGQQRDLNAAGCSQVFAEQVSSIGKRTQLEAALDCVRDGDTLMVTRPDRLARSLAGLLALVAKLNGKGVKLRILSMNGGAPMNADDPTAQLMLSVLGAVAQFERDLMLERQKEGIAKAKGEGRYRGRKPTAFAKSVEITQLRSQKIGATDIAKRLGIGRASVYRVLKQAETKGAG